MKKDTTATSPLQAPTFEEAKKSTLREILLLNIQIEGLIKVGEMINKELEVINKRLDILDQVVLNIPREEK